MEPTNNTSPYDFDFSAAFRNVLGIAPDKAADQLASLDVDQMLELVDALKAGDKMSATRILKTPPRHRPQQHQSAVQPMESIVENESLIAEGFNFTVKGLTDLIRDKLIDWMESKGYEYQFAPQNGIHVKCDTRQDAYSIGRALTNLNHRFLRDDEQNLEQSLEEMDKNERKKWKSNKMTMTVKRPNPVKKELLTNPAFRGKTGGPEGTEKKRKTEVKGDAWNRKGKHKRSDVDEHAGFFGIGDKVQFGEHEVTIQIPHGPGDTVGVLLDGVLQMVNRGEIDPVNEGVLGMSLMPGLQRMRELAGIREDDMSDVLGAHPPAMAPDPMLNVDQHDSMFPQDDIGDEGTPPAAVGGPPPGAMPSAMPGGMDAMAGDDEMGFDDEMAGDDLDGMGGHEMGGSPEMGVPAPMGAAGDPMGAPDAAMGDPSMDGEMLPEPMGSDAFSQIDDALNNIQRQLSDVKISEYKGLINRLEDLAVQARKMGHDFLSENTRPMRRKIGETRPDEKQGLKDRINHQSVYPPMKSPSAFNPKQRKVDEAPEDTSVIIIKKTPHEEYRMNPMNGREETAYYATDLEDAIASANHAYPGAKVLYRSKAIGLDTSGKAKWATPKDAPAQATSMPQEAAPPVRRQPAKAVNVVEKGSIPSIKDYLTAA